MTNWHVQPDLLAYAEGRLSAHRAAPLEAHLAACPACRAAAADLATLHDNLRALPAALRPLERHPAHDWPVLWARVTAVRPAAPRPAWPRALPRLSFYVSLLAVAFTAATLVPGSFGLRPAVTAGVVETPAGLALTPRAADPQLEAAAVAHHASVAAPLATTAFAAGPVATPFGPAPAPTPKP
ncbi:MAG: zf-HC2 domain-containing protein [Anaerolineales bacterium]|nr:zf-HC2 domain-containing protein [Anaerolineales bacterium]